MTNILSSPLYCAILAVLFAMYAIQYTKSPFFVDETTDTLVNIPNTQVPVVFPAMLAVGLGSYHYMTATP